MDNHSESTLELEFEDNRLLPLLFGERDRYLKQIEQHLDISVHARGNRVLIAGLKADALIAQRVLNHLYDRLRQGHAVTHAEVQTALRLSQPSGTPHSLKADLVEEGILSSDITIPTRRRSVGAKTPGQKKYIQTLQASEMVFAIGPAGTGKTYLAVAMAVSMMLEGKVSRIILSRPAVEAGENLGFLPGDIREKVDPYLRPLYDALYDMLPVSQVNRRIQTGEIEIAPLAFMRGRTLSNAFIILDEAQNATPAQMKMFLTRLGDHSRMVITGDLTQIDLPKGVPSGLKEAEKVLNSVKGINFCYLTARDIVRHSLVTHIVEAYHKFDKETQAL